MRRIWFLVLIGVLLFGAGVPAAEERTQTRDSLQQQEQVYGWELMNEQERNEHQKRMREMNTAEEREAYRKQHHERMQNRARQQGTSIPDSPGSYGKGMGSGGGGGGKR